MKEKYNSLPPFLQAIMLFSIGLFSFFVLSMLFSVTIGNIYPEMSDLPLINQATDYPIQYMVVYFLPMQFGFILVPGLIYFFWTRQVIHRLKKVKFIPVIWSFVLFLVAFFMLPFFNTFNFEVTKWFGAYEELMRVKEMSDELVIQLVGEVGSSSYYVSILVIGLLPGIAEELTFRRFLFHHFLKNTNKLFLSVFSSSFVFALLHFNYIQIVPLLVFGIVLALMYYATNSIIPGIVAHTLNNTLNIYWMASDSFPRWMQGVNTSITITATIILVSLLIFFSKKIAVEREGKFY